MPGITDAAIGEIARKIREEEIHDKVMERYRAIKGKCKNKELRRLDIEKIGEEGEIKSIIEAIAIIEERKIGPEIWLNDTYIGYGEYKAYFTKNAQRATIQLYVNLANAKVISSYDAQGPAFGHVLETVTREIKERIKLEQEMEKRIQEQEIRKDKITETLLWRIVKGAIKGKVEGNYVFLKEADIKSLGLESKNKREKKSQEKGLKKGATKIETATLKEIDISKKELSYLVAKISKKQVPGEQVPGEQEIRVEKKLIKKKLNGGLFNVMGGLISIWVLCEGFRYPPMCVYSLIFVYCLRWGFFEEVNPGAANALAGIIEKYHPAAYAGSQAHLAELCNKRSDSSLACKRMEALLKIFIKGVVSEKHRRIRFEHKARHHEIIKEKAIDEWTDDDYEQYVCQVIASSILGPAWENGEAV